MNLDAEMVELVLDEEDLAGRDGGGTTHRHEPGVQTWMGVTEKPLDRRTDFNTWARTHTHTHTHTPTFTYTLTHTRTYA